MTRAFRHVLSLVSASLVFVLWAGPAAATPKDSRAIYSTGPGMVHFDGNGSVVAGSHRLSKRFTLSAHVRVRKSERWQHVVELGVKEHGWSGALRLAVGKEGEWYLALGDGGSYRDVTVQSDWKYGEWHHLAVTYDGSRVRLLEDGKQLASMVMGREVTRGSGSLFLGSYRGTGRFFRGDTRAVTLFNAVLPPGRLVKLRKAPPPDVTLVDKVRVIKKGEQIAAPHKLVPAKSHTLAFWLRPLSARPALTSVMHFGGSDGQRLPALFFAPGKTRLELRVSRADGKPDATLASKAPLALDTWTHVALVTERRRVVLYIDGKRRGALALPAAGAAHRPLWASSPWHEAARAQIAKLGYAARAMSATEIAKLSRAKPVSAEAEQLAGLTGTARERIAAH